MARSFLGLVIVILFSVIIGITKVPSCKPEAAPATDVKPVETETKIELPPFTPCKGVINPSAIVYQICGESVFAYSKLKAQYYQCDVVQRVIATNGDVYFLVKITQKNVKDEYYLLDANGVIFLRE